MSNVFETSDPRGREVVCTEECWNDHILSSHPWMKEREEEVKAAVENPSIGIYGDADFPDRQIYYYLQKEKKRYLKVVVQFTTEDEPGNVITAFTTDSPKKGEKLIWPILIP